MATLSLNPNRSLSMTSSGDEEERYALVERCKANQCAVFLAFLLVGTGAGSLVLDAVFQLLTNKPEVQLGGKMFGLLSEISGWASLGSAGLYLLYLTAAPRRLSPRGLQRVVVVLILSAVAMLASLAAFWDVGVPQYPVVIFGEVVGNLVLNFTYFFLFPLVSASYGGWLVSCVRTGTDMSCLLTSILGQAENPTGNENLFEPWILLLVYTLIATMGLVAWITILRFGIGFVGDDLEEADSDDEEEEEEEDVRIADEELTRAPRSRRRRAWLTLRRLAPPKSLVLPISCAAMVEVTQWGILITLGNVAASMTDPESCDGHAARAVFRHAQTLNRVTVPLASLASTVAVCPRWIFVILTQVQVLSATIICTICGNLGRAFWTSLLGQTLFKVLFMFCGGLEGYVLTMAYRYIGDAKRLTGKDKENGCNLLSFLSVVVPSVVSIVLGGWVEHGAIRCIEPWPAVGNATAHNATAV